MKKNRKISFIQIWSTSKTENIYLTYVILQILFSKFPGYSLFKEEKCARFLNVKFKGIFAKQMPYFKGTVQRDGRGYESGINL